MSNGNSHEVDANNGHDYGMLETVQQAIDSRVHGALKAGARSGLQVLGSGFGKGVLVAAVLATIAIVGLTIFAPATLSFSAMPVANAVEAGLMKAGNMLLGFPEGWAILATGGLIGGAVAAHSENSRLNKEQAEAQAASYAKIREGSGNAPQLAAEQSMECSTGHCAQLLQAQKRNQKRGRG